MAAAKKKRATTKKKRPAASKGRAGKTIGLPDLAKLPGSRSEPKAPAKPSAAKRHGMRALSSGAHGIAGSPVPAYQLREIPPQNRRAYPHSAIGKLRMRVTGASGIGSAAVIGFNTILTAGHCVAVPELKKQVTSVEFTSAYEDNDAAASLGTWTNIPGGIIPHPRWLQTYATATPDWRYDVAIVRLASNAPGPRGMVGRTCGRLAVNGGASLSLPLRVFGYPAADNVPADLRFDGGDLYDSTGGYVGAYWPTTPASPEGVASPMAYGASGGPWIYDYSAGPGAEKHNQIIGLSSFIDSGSKPGCLYSPRFIGEVESFLADAIRKDAQGLPP